MNLVYFSDASGKVETISVNNQAIDPLTDLMLQLKSREIFLAANAKSDRDIAKEYLNFLLELHRFEEAYEKAVEISEFLPDLKKSLACYAIHLFDVNIVRKHVSHLSLNQNAPNDEWINLIFYHYVNGTIDELIVTHPLPDNREIKAVLYFLAGDFFALFNLLQHKVRQSVLEEWLFFIACSRLEYESLREACLDSLLERSLPFPSLFIRQTILECLGLEKNERRRCQIVTYLESMLKKNPSCLYTLRAIVNLSQNPILVAEMGARLKKTMLAYPSKTNKAEVVLFGPGDEKNKIESLLKTFYSNDFNFNLFRALYLSNYLDPDKALELVRHVISLYPTPFFECYQVELLVKRLEEKFCPEQVRSTLKLVESLLSQVPHNRYLIMQKGLLLAKCSEINASINAFKQYYNLYGIRLELLTTIDSLAELNKTEFYLDLLKEGYKVLKNKKVREMLIRAFMHHYHQNLEAIEFIISTLSESFENQKADFDHIVSFINDDIKEKAYALIDKVPRDKEILLFIAKRAKFYSDIQDERAVKDIEFINRFNPIEAKTLNFDFLMKKGQFVDATLEMLTHKIDATEEAFELLITELFNRGKFELIVKLNKFCKVSISYDQRLYITISYYQTKRYREALAFFKELLLEEPLDEQLYYYRACCFVELNQIGNAIDTIDSGLENIPDHELLLDYKKELLAKSAVDSKQEKQPSSVEIIKPKTKPDPKKVPYLIEETPVKAGKKPAEIDGPKPEKVKKVLQPASSQAVDPLKDPLADIKAIAKKGEKETGPKEKPAPTLAPIAVPPKTELPKPIVKLTLRPKEKVFLKKAHTALCEYNAMKTPLLSQEIVFRNQIYTILRVFTPLRLNAKHPQLIGDLKRIRDNARHDTDQISQERLDTLFNYLKSINLEHQVQDWLREKSLITKLMLQNQFLTVRRPKKTPQERVVQELEFILKNRGEKATFSDRLYHRNAIKASLSIIGEASNFLKDEQKNLLREYREAGNDFAHEFFIDGETLENVERLKEEEISPDALWNLIQNAETLLHAILRNAHAN